MFLLEFFQITRAISSQMLAEGSLSMVDTSFIQTATSNDDIVLESSREMEISTPIASKKRKIDQSVLNHQIDLIADSPAVPSTIKSTISIYHFNTSYKLFRF